MVWLQKVILKNFKPYREETEINFTIECTSQGKHIFPIYGDNGFGKTSLLDAIYWGLYGNSARKTKLMINDRALSNPGEHMYVTLQFYDELTERSIVINREAEIRENGGIKEELRVIIDGESVTGNNLKKQQLIEDLILPPEISRFFFFDAEDVKNLAREQGGPIVKDSVEELLGFKAIRRAIEDLEAVRGELDTKLKKVLKQSQEFTELQLKLEKINKELETTKSELKRIIQELSTKKQKRAELERELAESNYHEVQTLQDRQKKLEGKLQELKDKKEKLKHKIEDISMNLHLLILKPILKEKLEDLTQKINKLEKEKENVLNTSFRIRLIEQLIEESRCSICGKIQLDSDIIAMKEELKTLKAEFPNIQSKVAKLEREYSHLVHLRSQLEEKFTLAEGIDSETLFQLRIEMENLDSEIRDTKRDIEEIREIFKNELSISVVSKITREISKIETEIGGLKTQKERLQEGIKRLEAEKKKLEKKVFKKGTSHYELKALEKRIEIVDLTKKALEEYLDKLIEKRREELLRDASNIFLKLTNKKDEYIGFEFSSETNYKFQIVCKDDSRPNMDTISYGEMEVVALSFILGLNRYSTRNAPIITDTLFGRLSPYVQENIAKLFAEMDNQIVLLVLKDMREGGKTEIDPIAEFFKDKICREFMIDRNQQARESKIIPIKVFGGEI